MIRSFGKGATWALALASALTISTASPGVAAPAGSGEELSFARTDTTTALVRRDVKDLTLAERSAFISAVLKAKATPDPLDPTHSYYDRFVALHREAFSCKMGWNQRGNWAGAAHFSPTFLPWHRELLLTFEDMLQEVSGDPTMTVPYWDWTDQASTAAVFTADFLGGNGDPAQGYALTTGPFAKGSWRLDILDPISVQKASAIQTDYIQRNFGNFLGKRVYRPKAIDVSHALHATHYDVTPYDAESEIDASFRNMLEGWREAKPATCNEGWIDQSQASGSPHAMHNAIHIWVAGVWTDAKGVDHQGTMGYNTSPNDPVFFLHHANVDRIFAAWERDRLRYFQPLSGAPFGWNAKDTMWPWRDRTINSLFGTIRNGYEYQTLPS